MRVRKVSTYGDNVRWVADFGEVNGKRKRKFFKTQGQARAAIRMYDQERGELGQVWAQLTPKQRAEAAEIMGKAKKAGTSLTDLWEFWERNQARRAGRTLGQVFDELMDARSSVGLSEQYLVQLRAYLRAFALDREDMDIADVTPAVIDKWFAGRKESPWTRQTGINRLSALFSFCIRRGYLTENPVKRVERVRVPHVEREILSNQQCKRLVESALETDLGLLTYLGLALFCGFRPEEAKRITREEIDLERGIVTLEAGKSKVRNWRFVTLTEPAKHCIRAGRKLDSKNFPKRLRALRKHAKITEWPHDVLRKTAASHFYNIYGIDKATEQLGHSANVMLRVYRNLVTEKQTAEWLGITPVELAVVEGGKSA